MYLLALNGMAVEFISSILTAFIVFCLNTFHLLIEYVQLHAFQLVRSTEQLTTYVFMIT